MKTIIAKYSWLAESDLRLDASYHLSDTNRIKHLFRNLPYQFSTIEKQSKRIFSGNIFKRTFVSDPQRGIPYITGSDMIKSEINSGKFISSKQAIGLENLKLDKGWILVSCSGTLGKTVLTNELFISRIATHDLIRIIPNNKDVNEGFLYAFLSSKYGFSLLTQSSYGGVVKHIEPHHIANIPVPILPIENQQLIQELITKSTNLRVEANKMFAEILNQINSKYNLSPRKQYYTVNIKSILQGDKYTKESRIEADFYQPQAENLRDEIKKQEWAFLGDLTNEIRCSDLRERRFVEIGIPLITGQHLNLNKLSELKMLSKKFTRNIEKNTTKQGDILISVLGTIGKIEYSYNNIYQGVFASQQITKVSVNQELIHPGYIYAFLKSKFGQIQLQKYKTGSVIEWIIDNNIASIVVPIPSDKGLKIGSIVDKLTLMRQDAYSFEATAIQLIETEIEQWQN
ncbi:MAG: restriction endonuclease subunit S [Salinivirgaceae bacterium]|jgi:restriction endonuclease S subunit